MTARKLNKNNPDDLFKAFNYAAHGESFYMNTAALNPNEYAGYTVASLIPGLDDTDWETIYEAVNEAVEKAVQGDSDLEEVLLFNISDYHGSPHLVVVELFGYDPTNWWCWTSVRARLLGYRG